MNSRRPLTSAVGVALAALIAVCAAVGLLAGTALADTYTVGTPADASAAACPNPATTPCSLRQLILYIHAHPFPPDTIIVPAGTYTLQRGQLLINDNMSIVGAGANRTVIQEPVPADRTTMGDRVFDIEAVTGGATPTVSISGVEISGGDANASNPVDQFFGGDIRNAGVLTLTDDWVTNGFACSGGGVGNNAGTLTIEQSLISGNHAACGGSDSGGVENFGVPGSPDLPGHLVIDDSTIAGNDAGLVGGVFSWNDPNNTLTISNSTVADNITRDEPTACPLGGGCHARGPGGGLGLGAGTARIRNTIIAGNVEITGGVTTATNCAPGPGLTSLGNNIDSGSDCSLSDTIPGQADQSDTNPLLGPLQNNGGPTLTMALAPGSPALNRVSAGAGCPSVDQRGVPRPQGIACDIGAFELQVPPTCGAVAAQTAPGGSTVTIGMSCSGTAPGTLTYRVVSSPAHGTLSGFNPGDGVVNYTPDPGFTGTDSFTYDGTSSGGTATRAAVTITVPPVPVPAPQPQRINAALTWSFGLSTRSTKILSLIATGVAKGAELRVSCTGSGCGWQSHTSVPPTPKHKCKAHNKCPKATQSPTDNLTHLFQGWQLRSHAKLTVEIVKAGFVGKVFIFSFRPPGAPSSRITCLAPGSKTPGTGC
jgi:hypothetical protein